MIELHTHEKDEFGSELMEKMRRLRLAFKAIDLDDHTAVFVIDGNKKISGEEALNTWFRELEKELHIQRSITGDACYIDPETGKVC